MLGANLGLLLYGEVSVIERLNKAEFSRAYLSEPSFPNTKYWQNISRKKVHVVILRVTKPCVL